MKFFFGDDDIIKGSRGKNDQWTLNFAIFGCLSRTSGADVLKVVKYRRNGQNVKDNVHNYGQIDEFLQVFALQIFQAILLGFYTFHNYSEMLKFHNITHKIILTLIKSLIKTLKNEQKLWLTH